MEQETAPVCEQEPAEMPMLEHQDAIDGLAAMASPTTKTTRATCVDLDVLTPLDRSP